MTDADLRERVAAAVAELGVAAVSVAAGVSHQTVRRFLAGGEIRAATRAALLRWTGAGDDPDVREAVRGNLHPEAEPERDLPRYDRDHLAQQIERGRLPLWGSGA